MNEVTCASCGAIADADQRFCGECGNPMSTGCPNCGAPTKPGQKFCGTCGTRLDGAATAGSAARPAAATGAAQPSNGAGVGIGAGATAGAGAGATVGAGAGGAPVAERKLVSVLFADLVGFTPFAEERDSEDVRDTLTRYFDLASEVITKYNGTVEKFIGDAVMAVWGTPTTREDDAERAVRAALELVDSVSQLGSGIQARAGVLTGETAVTIGASNQGMVAGDLVNTAARLQSAAAPGTVLVGEATYRAASVAIAFEPAGEQTLKGKAAPVQAWRALRVVAERGGRGRADQLEPPFVGRDVELRLLKDLFHATGAEKRLRHVSVVGTAGIGKSRLVWEFEKYLDGIHEFVLWNHGRSPAYGQGITFWSLGEMVRRRAGLAETDDHETTRAGIATMLDDVMPGHPNRAWVERSMLQLLGVAGGVSSAEMFGAWRAFFETLSARGTVVLVFQDVHWADSGTLDFIDHLVEWSREFPIYIVTLARPEILEERPEWGSARRGFTSVYLEPIGVAAMRDLLQGIAPDLPEGTVTSIVSQAEGVPLFAVEILRMLINTGKLKPTDDGATYRLGGDAGEIAVPETLTALIGARLDALDAADRALLLDAAVLGTSFTPDALAAVSGRGAAELEARLKVLTRRELLRHVVDPRSPERGQYAFVQALVRETAYNTLAKRDRQTRHLAAARWFESLGEPELVGALAGHFLAARSLAPVGQEADALAAQARIALKAAGDRAASLGSNRQAAEFYAQALSVTVDDADEAAICEVAADVAQQLTNFDVAQELLTRALEIHRARGDRVATARVIATLGEILLTARRTDEAIRLLRDGVAEFADIDDPRPVLHMKSQMARYHMLSLDYEAVLPLTDEVLRAAERTDDLPLLVDTMITRGTAISGVLRWREGGAVLHAAQDMAKDNGYNAMFLRAINNYMVIALNFDPQATLALVNDGLQLARRLGNEGWVQTFGGLISAVGKRTGNWDEALAVGDATMAGATDARTRSVAIEDIATIRAFRGESIDHYVVELDATAALDGGDITRRIAAASKCAQRFGAGDLAGARAGWKALAEEDRTYARSFAALPARTALWEGVVDAAEQLEAMHWAAETHGGASAIDFLSITSAVQGLRGDRSAAANGYRDAMRRYRELKLDLDLGLMAIDMVYVLGPDDSLTMEAVAAARSTFTRERARAFLDQLDLALAHGAHPVAEREASTTRASRKAGVPSR